MQVGDWAKVPGIGTGKILRIDSDGMVKLSNTQCLQPVECLKSSTYAAWLNEQETFERNFGNQ